MNKLKKIVIWASLGNTAPYVIHTNKSGKDWIAKLRAKQIKELFSVTQQTTLIGLPWKKVDSRIQECISWWSSGTLRATPGLTQEIMDLQPVNKSEILNSYEVMCADDGSLISERTTPSTSILGNILS